RAVRGQRFWRETGDGARWRRHDRHDAGSPGGRQRVQPGADSAAQALSGATLPPMRRLLPFALLLLAAIALALWRRATAAPEAPPSTGAALRGGTTAPAAAGDKSQPTPDAAPAQRDAIDERPEGPLVRGRVTGLLFGVPWTQPIQFELEGHDTERGGVQHHRERFVPGGDGAFALQLPAW